MNNEKPKPNSLSSEARVPSPPEIARMQPDFFERLKQRGIEYERVFHIMQVDVPQNLFFFARQFEKHTIKGVLKHIESWKQFLKQDYVLTEELKAKITRWVRMTEDFVWATIRDANFQIGDWTLYWLLTPPGEAPDGERKTSGVRVTATNQKTGEQRKHELPGYRRSARRALSDDCQEIYKALGLFDQLWLGTAGPFLISRRAAQGWPVYSRMIARLYDVLAPHYDSGSHYSEGSDWACAGKLERPARYSKELLEDMLTILRMHHGTFFENMTAKQLKARIQRHLSRRSTPKTSST